MKKIEIRPQKSSGSQAQLLQPGQDWVISNLAVHQEIVTGVLTASGQIKPQKNRRLPFQSGGRRLDANHGGSLVKFRLSPSRA